MRALWVLVLCAAVAVGCGKKAGGKTEVIPIDQVPKAMLEKARGKLPDVKFDTAWKLPDGNIELRGKGKSGKIHEVEFNPAGEVVEVD